MPNPDCIIAALDLDSRAEAVAERAAKLAAVTGARLTLLHVVEHTPGLDCDGVSLPTPRQVRGDMERHAKAWLLGLACHLDLDQAEILVLGGRLRAQLLDLVRQRGARCLVTGQSRWGKLGRLGGLEREPVMAELGCIQVRVTGKPDGQPFDLSRLLAEWTPRRA